MNVFHPYFKFFQKSDLKVHLVFLTVTAHYYSFFFFFSGISLPSSFLSSFYCYGCYWNNFAYFFSLVHKSSITFGCVCWSSFYLYVSFVTFVTS